MSGTGFGQRFGQSNASGGQMPSIACRQEAENPSKAGALIPWARLVSNQRPLACETSAGPAWVHAAQPGLVASSHVKSRLVRGLQVVSSSQVPGSGVGV